MFEKGKSEGKSLEEETRGKTAYRKVKGRSSNISDVCKDGSFWVWCVDNKPLENKSRVSSLHFLNKVPEAMLLDNSMLISYFIFGCSYRGLIKKVSPIFSSWYNGLAKRPNLELFLYDQGREQRSFEHLPPMLPLVHYIEEEFFESFITILMGRKKGTEREEENFEIAKQGGGGGGKLKKKNRAVIDDDEYSVGTELSEEPTVQDETVVHAFGKKKGKKGNKSGAKDDDDEMDEKPTKQGGGGGGGKSRKKNVVVDDDEYNIGIRTPICIPQKDFIDIGRLASIENIHRHVDYVKKGQVVDVKVSSG
ncbi:hypothetical protein RND71_036774 [Anisodus tanguticus]|uniref:Uncharacterized protein n=1 Tax=Anisodus tanguticus TaxID=243964 RepID=A0AAE1R1S8_9SOLA|nr:hypothetical protein RND71_036774 [Anisodus tanguticus]